MLNHESNSGTEYTPPNKDSIEALIHAQRLPREESDFDELLDKLALEFVLTNKKPEFDENKRAIIASRRTRNEESAVQQQRKLFEEAKNVILSCADLDPNAGKSELDVYAASIRSKVESYVQSGERSSAILAHLGMIVEDENGDEHFSYPVNLFPKQTNEKWHYYLRQVRDHLKAKRQLEFGTGTQAELTSADYSRRVAHDAVTTDIHTLLGLDKVDDEWDNAQTRELVTKIREARFPNVPTKEKHRTANAIISHSLGADLEGLSVAKAMRRDILPDYDSLPYPPAERPRFHS